MTNESAKAEQAVIFLHVPKTAGTTLHRIIERQYRPEQVYSFGPLAHESINEFQNMSEARRAEIRMLKGHMGFGLHEYLPGPSTYFTVLREPIERVISYYYFVRRTPQHYLYDFISSDDKSLKGFIESRINIMLDNAQTRMISGVWYELGFGECTEAVLEAAKRNLRENFTVVGLTEKFDETLLLLKRAFGWQSLFYARQNVTANRPVKDALSPATLEAVVKFNRLDIELYQYGTTLFQEQVRQQGPSFAREVERFQRANRWLSPLISAYWEIRKRSVRVFVRKWIQRPLC
jgi:hypothetical protein